MLDVISAAAENLIPEVIMKVVEMSASEAVPGSGRPGSSFMKFRVDGGGSLDSTTE